jgi:hypothetical protein
MEKHKSKQGGKLDLYEKIIKINNEWTFLTQNNEWIKKPVKIFP